MRLNLGTQVLIAVIAGILVGLFLGPLATVFRPIVSIYVMILQMVVLPYIALSIIQGLGALTPFTAKQLFKKCWPFLALLWGIMFFIIYLFSTLIPKPLSAIFSSQNAPTDIREDLTKNILTFLVPANPLYDFVNNIVPAIAVFGVIGGIALMHINKKEPFLSLVDRGNQMIEKILGLMAKISPIGAFAQIALVMGTIDFSDLYKVEFYVVSFVFITFFVTFWILPLLLSSLTPMSFRESFHAIRTVCLLAFVTGISTIAIPFINTYLRKINHKSHFGSSHDFRSSSQTILPISFSFAQIGNCFVLFFILFAAFYFRHPMTSSEKSILSFLTIPLSMGSAETSFSTVSFLFKELNFSSSATDLFHATMPITMNFQVLISVAGILSFILLTLFANRQNMQSKWKSFLVKFIGSFALLSGSIWAVYPFVHLEDNYRNLFPNRKIAEAIEHPIQAKVYLPGDSIPDNPLRGGSGVLERIMRSGVLRVGYDWRNIPYAYFNHNTELVGFDIAMAYQLAEDLNCQLEFIPQNVDRLDEELNAGLYDIAMSAILVTEKRIQFMSFTDVYSDENNVLLIPIKKRAQFAQLANVQKRKDLIIGAMGGYKRVFAQNFPNAIAHEGNFDSDMEEGRADAWIWSQIPATVWCLNHPDFIFLDYDGLLGKSYLAYAVQLDALTFVRFMNNWIQLKVQNKFYQQQYDYWIMGKSPQKSRKPRWSVMHNVLHWSK